MTVLVVDDEPQLAASLIRGLTEDGFVADAVGTGAEAIARVATGRLQAIVLDLGLPDLDGQAVIVQLRLYSDVPILILTARDAIAERVLALDSGADDYLVKPFAFEELLARLRALLRRAEPRPRRSLCAGDVGLVVGEPAVQVAGRAVMLSPRERALLELLVSRIGDVIPRRDILRDAFGYDFDPGTNIVEVHVGHLRRKLGKSLLQIDTVRGYGYRARVP